VAVTAATLAAARNEDRARAHLLPHGRDRFTLGPQTCVCEQADQRRVARAAQLEQPRADRFDLLRGNHDWLAIAPLSGLAHEAHRVSRDLFIAYGSLEDRLQHGEGLDDGWVTDFFAFHRSDELVWSSPGFVDT